LLKLDSDYHESINVLQRFGMEESWSQIQWAGYFMDILETFRIVEVECQSFGSSIEISCRIIGLIK
jgi:hypothetical protein